MKRAVLEALLAARAAKRPVALLTDLGDGRQVLVEAGAVRAGDPGLAEGRGDHIEEAIYRDRGGPLDDGRLFLQVFNPPLRLLVVGAVHIAQSLAPMAALAGYAVTLIDPRKAWATDARFPGLAPVTDWPDEALRALGPDHRSAVVILTHDPKLDDPALEVSLASEAFYIGALGSTRTHAKRLDRLRELGLGEDALARIHGPIGLAIGAKSPAEIAIAILAEITRALHRAPGGKAAAE